MPQAVIVGGIRTPFVKAGGPMRFVPTQELGRLATRELLYRFDLRPDQVDELIAGNVGTPPDATNVARVIALNSGIPKDRVAHTVSRNCASGFEALSQAVDRVQAGQAQTVVALGVESMSNAPLLWTREFAEHLLNLAKAKSPMQKLSVLSKIRLAHLKPLIGLTMGLRDPVSGLMMGDTADKLAREFSITRTEQDEFALRSHQRAAAAWKEGRLGPETMPVFPEPSLKPITQDIGPRANQSLEQLNRLKPFFDRRYGTITVGNACQVTDGAAALLVMEESLAKAQGFKPLGRVKGYAYAGCDPARMGLGPVYATHRVLGQLKMKLSQMELIELNEAFAAQVLACVRAFHSQSFAEQQLGRTTPMGEVDMDKLNVNGGAIALGHPVGATGTRITLTLLEEMQRRNLSVGLATLCVGGGLGGAFVLERN